MAHGRPAPPAGRTSRFVRGLRPVCIALLATALGACSAGGLPRPSPTPPDSGTGGPVTASATGAPVRLVTPVPADLGAEPPAAIAVGLDAPAGGTLSGELGSFTWAGAGSDAPWIVPSSGGRVARRASIAVEFEPERGPGAWVARWAPVDGRGAGDVAVGADGSGDVVIAAPARGGTWALQLEARFAQGHHATWYWRFEVGP